jgi:hypothetical protein
MNANESNNEIENKLLKDKIKISDVVKVLQVTDVRTAIRWCRKKTILVWKFGKERYINLIDFELAVDRPFIESLKIKYPTSWKEMYDAYKNGDYITIAEQMFQATTIVKTKFVVQGEVANNFIKKIKQKLKENGRSQAIKD